MSEDRGSLDARAILEALNEARVEFIVIGGLAVGAHGYPRGTKDIDIVPDPGPENLAKLAAALEEMDYAIAGAGEFEPGELVQPDLEGLLGGGSWVLATKYGGLDIMQEVAPDLGYDRLEQEAVEDEVFGSPVRFCGYRHLVAMKEAADRPEDRVDLEKLRVARGER